MGEFLATSSAALVNVLALLGMGFILSRGFRLLRTRPQPQRKACLGIAFGAMAIGSMMMSFPIGEGLIGDMRNAVIAVAAIVGGPIPALIAAILAGAFRVHFGGQYAAAIAGIAIVTAISIGYAKSHIPKTPENFVLFGIVLAVANAFLPLAASLYSPLTLGAAIQAATTILVFALALYPLVITMIAVLLCGEQAQAEDEAHLRSANAVLSMDAARAQGVFERSGVAMAWSDLKSGTIIRANPCFAEFTGYTEAELIGMSFNGLSVPGDREKDSGSLKPFIAGTTTSVNDERRYLRKDGKIVWGMRSLTVVHEGGEPRYAFAIVQDITGRKRAREEIAYLASHDSLTGLVNRPVFNAEFLAASGRRLPGQMIAVLYLDLDHFKEVNDTLGHPAGDDILVEVAKRLRSCVDETDIVARFGGDEFAILRGTARTAEELLHLLSC